MFTVGSADELTLWFEIETTGEGSQLNSDTSEFPATPSAELGIKVTEFDLKNLVGMQLNYLGTENDAEDSCDALFYYYEHQPLRDNQITIIAQNDTNRFNIRWYSRTQDVSFYDGSRPDAQVEIEADFQFENSR